MKEWEVRRDGKTICYGSEKTMPSREERKSLRNAGYKIYVDKKLFKE